MRAALLSTWISSAAAGPCDILQADGAPCVAAHSMVRALYDDYDGPLYAVERASDSTVTDVGVSKLGGVADASTQDAFCAGTLCTVSRIYDQSPMGNHLDVSRGGGPTGSIFPDHPVHASKAPVLVGGQRVYGARFEGKMGYRNNKAKGTARGDDPETIYAVVDGVHYNGKCCFDYGNAETNSWDDGKGTMEALYWGDQLGRLNHMGTGEGPWVAADLENGVWAGNETGVNPGSESLHFDFVTAMIKGKPGNTWAIKGGNAQGELKKFFEGPRPRHYEVMKKQGAIILGIGGDNSNKAEGTFYEGVMTSGYTSDAADAKVQADINAAGYSRAFAIQV